MKTRVYASISAAVLCLSVVVYAFAAQPIRSNSTVQQAPATRQLQTPATAQPTDTKPSEPTKKTPVPPVVPVGDLPQLPEVLTLSPAGLQGVKIPKSKGLTPEFHAAWKKVSEEYAYISANLPAFDQQLKQYYAKHEECTNKQYTRHDMAVAGCTRTDTAESCSKKLYSKCMGNAIADPALNMKMMGNMNMIKDDTAAANSEFQKSISQ